MAHTVVQRATMLICAALLCTGCFSASTPKDPSTFALEDVSTPGLLILDAAGPPDLGPSPTPEDTFVSPKDVTSSDTSPADTSSPPDITIPDFAGPDDSIAPVDVAPIEDIAVEDVTPDISPSDSTVEDTTPEDTAVDTAVEPDTNETDTTTPDTTGPVPCEGINCPGALAPEWAIEDFQPQSPWFQETYGLEKFQGKVTVMVLLAGW